MIPQMERKVKLQIGKVQDRASEAPKAVQTQDVVFRRDCAPRYSSGTITRLRKSAESLLTHFSS